MHNPTVERTSATKPRRLLTSAFGLAKLRFMSSQLLEQLLPASLIFVLRLAFFSFVELPL